MDGLEDPMIYGDHVHDDYTHDAEADAYYFNVNDGEVCRTQELGTRTVMIDWDHYGNIIGIEVL